MMLGTPLDPTKQDLWIMPLMSGGWHLWKHGSETSACGLPWSVAANAWDVRAERPATGELCQACIVADVQPVAAAS